MLLFAEVDNGIPVLDLAAELDSEVSGVEQGSQSNARVTGNQVAPSSFNSSSAGGHHAETSYNYGIVRRFHVQLRVVSVFGCG